MSQNSKYQEFGYREMKPLPACLGLFISSLSFFPSCFNQTAKDRKSRVERCHFHPAWWKRQHEGGAKWAIRGKSSHALSAMSVPSHLETQSSCTKVEEGTKDDRIMHQGQRKSNLPPTNGLIKFDKNEEGVYIEGLYCNKRLTMCINI